MWIGITSKTTKAIVSSAIPVVGKILGDAVDTVVGGGIILKNAIGLVGVIVVIGICIIPIIKLSILTISYKLLATVSQPIADTKIVSLLDQIGDVFTETILTENCNSKYISEEDSKKILNNIYWDDKNHTVKSVECSYDNENWINKHVKVAVYLETSEGKKEVYYKCYFKPNTETK